LPNKTFQGWNQQTGTRLTKREMEAADLPLTRTAESKEPREWSKF